MRIRPFSLLICLFLSASAQADAVITPKHIENLQLQLQHLELMIDAGKKSKQFNADELKQLKAKHAESNASLKEAQADASVSEPEYRQVRDLITELRTLLYTLGRNPGTAPEMVAPLSPYTSR
jgi:septal ring factor EnvC (AmiA/AmiB activator)